LSEEKGCEEMIKEIDKYILGIADTPSISTESQILNTSLTEHNNIKGILKKRNGNSHKGTYGKVGILSGSKGMAGAAVLNCNAALRSGAGLVKACITDSIYSIVESMSTEAITYPFNEFKISFDELNKELIQFSDVIATDPNGLKIQFVETKKA